MNRISKELQTNTTALSLFFQSILNIVIGLILMLNQTLFLNRTALIIFLYFGATMGFNVLQIVICIGKGFKPLIQSIFIFCASCTGIIYFSVNLESMIKAFPLILSIWTFFIAISSFISFIQYRKDKTTEPIRFLMTSIIHLFLGIFVIVLIYNDMNISLRMVGLYLVIRGATLFFDGIFKIIPEKYKDKYKSRIRVAIPGFFTALAPRKALNNVNKIFKETPQELPLKVERSDEKVNVEVFIHAAKSLKGTAGHVDICIDGDILCYGTYDRDNIKCGGILGDGVIYEIHDKEKYIEYCNKVKKETVFGFGFSMNEDELTKIKLYVKEIKSRTYNWQCKAQHINKNYPDNELQDSACKLSRYMHTKFYKFSTGTYKYYWILGTNCVKFTDDILKSSGITTILSGIITPGTYYAFLNNEFVKGNTCIVSRTVYHDPENIEVIP